MPTRRSFLLAPILLFLLLNLALLLSLWSKNETQKAARQHLEYLTKLTQNLQDVDRQLTALYRTTANPSLTSLTFLNTDSFDQRTALYEKVTQAEELEKKALSSLGRSFALLSLLLPPNANTPLPQHPITTIRPALESYLDEVQKTLILYQWLTASDKALKPLLDFLTTFYLALGRGKSDFPATFDGGGFYPPFVREDLASYRQALKGLSAQPYPANLPFASTKVVEARQQIIDNLSTVFDRMTPSISTRTSENISQLKILLTTLDASLTKDSFAAKINEKDFWAANLQLQKSAYLLQQLKLLNP